MKNKKLIALTVESFVTTLDETERSSIAGGGDRPVPTIASLPVRDCKPVPTTDFQIPGTR